MQKGSLALEDDLFFENLGKRRFFHVLAFSTKSNPTGIYLLKVNNRNTRTKCETCSKLTIKTPERSLASFWCLYC